MFSSIPCWQPFLSDITINFNIASPRSLAYMTLPILFLYLTQSFIKCLCTLAASSLVTIY